MPEYQARIECAVRRGPLVQRGQGTVEFALVFLLLMAVVLGVLEVSRLMFINAEIDNAAREGSRYASINAGVTTASLETYVKSKLTLADRAQVRVYGPTYNSSDIPRCVFCQVSVTVEYDWQSFITLVNLGTINLNATATKLVEN